MDELTWYLKEDLGEIGDITSDSLFTNESILADILAQEICIIAGLKEIEQLFVNHGCIFKSEYVDGDRVKADTIIAKNYLKEDEINILNRIVTAYLEFAELQAIRKKPMYMRDWLEKLDDFLKMTDNEILNHAGTISHEQAKEKVSLEYNKYKEKMKNELSTVEKHFIESIDEAEKMLKRSKK